MANPKKSQKINEDHESKAVKGCHPILGFFYLLHDPNRKLYQLGITIDPNKRVNTHRNNGWQVMQVFGPACYNCIKRLERDCINELKSLGISIGKRAARKMFETRFDGDTESWLASEFAPENDSIFFWKIQINPQKYGLYTARERDYQDKAPQMLLEAMKLVK